MSNTIYMLGVLWICYALKMFDKGVLFALIMAVFIDLGRVYYHYVVAKE